MTNSPAQHDDDGGLPATTPLWVKIFGLVALVVVLLFVVLLFTGGHGPGRHGANDAQASWS